MKQNKNKKAAFAESKQEFTQYMRTYCEMQLGWKHPLSQQTPLWWAYQYDVLESSFNTKTEDKPIKLFSHKSILRIEKLGSQWHETQEWTGEFHGVMGKVVISAGQQ